MIREPGISKAKLFEQLEYKPHSARQRAAHDSKARFRIPCCGRRWGKSTFAARELDYAAFVPNAHYWIVGPDYSLAEKEFRIVYRDLMTKLGLKGMKGVRATYNPKQGDMRIELPWQTIIEAKSAQKKDSLVGEGLDGVIVSEAAKHDRDTWEMYLEPALTDKRGWAIFPSTPQGYNWYEGLFALGQDSKFADYESWRLPTWTNSAMFEGFDPQCPNEHRNDQCVCDPELVRVFQIVSRGFWRQEYAAEFTAFEGQIYEDFDVEIHVKDITYNPIHKNYITLDFGFKDPFCCYDIMVDAMDRIYIWREYQVSGMSTWEHGRYILNRSNPEGYHVDGIYADPRGADEIATLQPMLGWIVAPNVPWIQGIESIQRRLKVRQDGQPGLYIGRDCPHLIRQLGQLRHKEVREGTNVRREGQHDYDDHGPDAIRYFTGPYDVLGSNSHLSDIYAPDQRNSEAATFFKLHSGFTHDPSVNPW